MTQARRRDGEPQLPADERYNRPMPSSHTHPGGRQPGRNEAPVFWQCQNCGFISPQHSAPGEATKCPECGGALRPFPPDRLHRVDERIRHYQAEGEYEVVVILVATLLESLMEDLLARIMAAEGASVRLSQAVLDTLRSIGQRLGKLFPTLTGTTFEDAAAEAGFPDFPLHWRQLRTERNAFIHDAAFEGPREELGQATAEKAIVLLDQGYKLFVRINNRFVAGTPKRRKGDRAQ